MTQKFLCLSAALLFAFAAMNVATAEEAVVVAPADCPCAKAAGPCQCGPVCQCGTVCQCNMCCPPLRYRVAFPRIIRPVYYAPVCRPYYYAPRFYRVPYYAYPGCCW